MRRNTEAILRNRLKRLREEIRFVAEQLAMAYAAPACYQAEKEEELARASQRLYNLIRLTYPGRFR